MNKFKKYDSGIMLGIATIIMLLFLSIGYAIYHKDLDFRGTAGISGIGKVEITKVELDTSATNTLKDYGSMVLNDDGGISLNYKFDLKRNADATYKDTYIIYVTNNSQLDYVYTSFSLNPIVTGASSQAGVTPSYVINKNHEKNTLTEGDILAIGETKTLVIDLTMKVKTGTSATITVTGDGNINYTLDKTGSLLASLSPDTVDLRNNKDRECFSVRVINTYKYTKSFSLESSNRNFSLVDKAGNPFGDFSVGAPSDVNARSNDQEYEVCIKSNEGSVFLSDTATTSIILNSNNMASVNAGSLTVMVDEKVEEDNAIPEISNVNMTINKYNTENQTLIVDTNWTRADVGGTNITGYHVLLYDGTNNTLVKTYNINSDVTNYQIVLSNDELTNLKTNMVENNHDYFIKVYGEDEAGNTGQSYCSSDANSYCPSSSSIKLKWEFIIDTSGLKNMSLSSDSSTVVYVNNTYQASLIGNTAYDAFRYNLPSSITVKMGEQELVVNTDYTYSSANNGTIVITKPITDNIAISGTAEINCLVEGTKIRLAGGISKNIEDVTYYDLIETFNNDLGKVVYTYPIWIAKKGSTSEYQEITFSDGTILKTVGAHGIFNKDINEYVSVLDRGKFNIGTNVVKVNVDGSLTTVSVVDIKLINEVVNFYHVEATRYHNVISNNILTTDPLFIISNMFDFNDDLTWSLDREEFLSHNDLFRYEDWSHLFPRHLFYGLRMPETKVLYNKGLLDIDVFNVTLNGEILEPNKSAVGKNLWLITTSDDLDNLRKGELLEEGDIYQLKEPIGQEGKKFKGWYNTSDNKIYQPNDLIEVYYGMFFESIWE